MPTRCGPGSHLRRQADMDTVVRVKQRGVDSRSTRHCFFDSVMLFHVQKTLTLAQRRADLARKAKPWNIRALHSSRRCRKQYLDASQKVSMGNVFG